MLIVLLIAGFRLQRRSATLFAERRMLRLSDGRMGMVSTRLSAAPLVAKQWASRGMWSAGDASGNAGSKCATEQSIIGQGISLTQLLSIYRFVARSTQ